MSELESQKQKRRPLDGREKHVAECANLVRRTLKEEVLPGLADEDLGVLMVRLGANAQSCCERFVQEILKGKEES